MKRQFPLMNQDGSNPGTGAATPAAGAPTGPISASGNAGAGAGAPNAAGAAPGTGVGSPAQGAGAAAGGKADGQSPKAEESSLLGVQEPKKDEQKDDKTGDQGKPNTDVTEFVPKLPEGVKLDEELVKEFQPFAKKLGAEEAQKAVEIYVKGQQRAVETLQQQSQQAVIEQNKAWQAEVKNDKDVGGPKFDETRKLARKGIEWAGGPELMAELDKWGFGNNPMLYKAFVKVGGLIGEDSIKGTNGLGDGQPSEADLHAVQYPKMTQALKDRGQLK
jgi:hypothetical protein